MQPNETWDHSLPPFTLRGQDRLENQCKSPFMSTLITIMISICRKLIKEHIESIPLTATP